MRWALRCVKPWFLAACSLCMTFLTVPALPWFTLPLWWDSHLLLGVNGADVHLSLVQSSVCFKILNEREWKPKHYKIKAKNRNRRRYTHTHTHKQLKCHYLSLDWTLVVASASWKCWLLAWFFARTGTWKNTPLQTKTLGVFSDNCLLTVHRDCFAKAAESTATAFTCWHQLHTLWDCVQHVQ